MSEMDANGACKSEVAVLVVPFPSHGHLNQLLHLSCLLSAAKGVAVHYVSTVAHSCQAKRRIQGWDRRTVSKVHFHEFPLLSVNPLDNDHYNASTKFPSHLQPMFEASLLMRKPVSAIIRDLSAGSRRVVIIHDSMMGSVIQDFVDYPNAESYVFHSVSAFSIFFFLWERKGRPFHIDSAVLKTLPSNEGCFTPEFVRFISKQHEYMNLSSGRIYNTCRAIESRYLDLLSKPQINKKKQWAFGSFNPVRGSGQNPRHKCLKWLDSQEPNSVILVSFGTTTSLSGEEIKELAIGLEKSEVKFIWVLRDADRADVLKGREVEKAEFPKGFKERVKEMGIIVRDWAPQLEILGHHATGGFLSHCGWNSCMESISMGVPIAAWPMHSDQPRNAVLVTKVLKIGVPVKDWSSRDELVSSWAVASAVRKLMVSEVGAEIRKRAVELGSAVRRSTAEGGVTRLELDSFISHVTRK